MLQKTGRYPLNTFFCVHDYYWFRYARFCLIATAASYEIRTVPQSRQIRTPDFCFIATTTSCAIRTMPQENNTKQWKLNFKHAIMVSFVKEFEILLRVWLARPWLDQPRYRLRQSKNEADLQALAIACRRCFTNAKKLDQTSRRTTRKTRTDTYRRVDTRDDHVWKW